MDVTRYTFQSPYPSQVQVGRPDTSTKQEEKPKEEAVELETNKIEPLKDTQKEDVAAVANAKQVLDLYA